MNIEVIPTGPAAPGSPEKTLAQRTEQDGGRAAIALPVGLGLCFAAPPVGIAVMLYGVYKGIQWLHKRRVARQNPGLAQRPMSDFYKAMGKREAAVHRDKAIKRGVESGLSIALGITACAAAGPVGIVVGCGLIGYGIHKGIQCRREVALISQAPERAAPAASGAGTASAPPSADKAEGPKAPWFDRMCYYIG